MTPLFSRHKCLSIIGVGVSDSPHLFVLTASRNGPKWSSTSDSFRWENPVCGLPMVRLFRQTFKDEGECQTPSTKSLKSVWGRRFNPDLTPTKEKVVNTRLYSHWRFWPITYQEPMLYEMWNQSPVSNRLFETQIVLMLRGIGYLFNDRKHDPIGQPCTSTWAIGCINLTE